MQELQNQTSQFGAWFTQAGERMKATESNIGATQQTLNAHQHEIHALGSTFQTTMKNVKDDLSSEMTQSFNNQMSRLEALLEHRLTISSRLQTWISPKAENSSAIHFFLRQLFGLDLDAVLSNHGVAAAKSPCPALHAQLGSLA